MIASTQITNTGIFAFIAALVFKLFSRKVVLRKNIFACLFSVHNAISLSRHDVISLLRKQKISRVNYSKFIDS